MGPPCRGVPALVIRSGPDAGKRYEIDGLVVVGRGDVDCVIDDAELSRRHVSVRVTASGVEIEDLGSLNGTWFEGKRVQGPTAIPSGGVFRLGVTEVEVEVGVPAADDDHTVIARVPPAASPAVPAAAPPPVPVPADPAMVVVTPPPAAQPPPAAVQPPPPPPPAATDDDSLDPPPTNVPIKPRSRSKSMPPAADAPPPAPPPPEAPPEAAADAPTVPPSRSRRKPTVPPPAPSRRPGAPSRAGSPGAFSPPGKPSRRKVATRLVVPAVLTFMTIFATAIALVVYFAAR